MTDLIGETKDNNMVIPLEALGAPGIWGTLEVVPYMIGETDADAAAKQKRTDLRDFYIKIMLGRSPSIINLKGDFGPEDGGSYVLVDAAHSHIEIGDEAGTLRFDKNTSNELSMVSTTLQARNAREAHDSFMVRFSTLANHLSYRAAIPFFVDLVVVRDVATEVQSMYFVSPPRSHFISAGRGSFEIELNAVYALYREAQNSTSPYYRVLCLYKIMEGLLDSMQADVLKRAKSNGISLPTPKMRVPDHPEFPAGIRSLVGNPMKEFFDNFLQKQFRDAMAHFNLKDKAPLNVSEIIQWARFMDVAFITDLCVRDLIDRHETWLRLLREGLARK